MPINKIFKSCEEAVADVFDGATVMVGGFGSYGGLPINLIVALANQGAKDLTVIANMGGVGFELTKRIKPGGYIDLAILFERGQVKKFIGSVPALGGQPPTSPLERLHKAGKLEVEVVPQGTLAERIRCAAGGIGGSIRPWAWARSSRKAKRRRSSTAKSISWNCPWAPTSP